MKVKIRPFDGSIKVNSLPMTIDSNRIEEVIACCREHRPIPPPAGGWDDLSGVLVAGVLMALALDQLTEPLDNEMASLPLERREAFADSVDKNLSAAMRVAATFAFETHRGKYATKYPPVIQGFCGMDGDTAIFERVISPPTP